ncbi:lysophospholipid acyltransferase family protein [Aneurinibacillus uraniidurans]|uniref:lysophospholipid acyltransferase family protein n=1 Tax=Aneurinibacillus uraniidurans TaxID=2966586 RepID=UPI0023490ABE|nr:lysophospholipid acyltransferase family protein [Aneurinibacillus sp. B1]WCN36727.1 lysophospholipid acyltransferase family protein [Aneurinibacillus sp. B1]
MAGRVYTFWRRVARILLAGGYRFRVLGQENVPDSGPLVLCCNHISNWDPITLGSGLERQVFFMAKEELFHVPIAGKLARECGAFPVKRGAGDRQAIRKALELLQEGHAVGIFPEGTRNLQADGTMREVQPGAAMIALKSGARVVPVAIIGAYRLFRPITIIYGKPFDLAAETAGENNTERMHHAATIIQREIQSLLDIHRNA